MSTQLSILEIIGRLNPAAWDWIVPHGPIQNSGKRGTTHVAPGAEVSLNPQPLPPGPDGAVAGSVLARRIAETAVTANVLSGDGPAVVSRIVDEWCGTPPQPWPWPKGWPHVLDVVGRPEVSAADISEMFAAATLVFAAHAAALDDGELRDSFRGAAEATAKRAEQATG